MQGNPRFGRAEVGPAAGRICHRAAGLPVARVTCSLPATRQRPGRLVPSGSPTAEREAGIRTLSSAPLVFQDSPAPIARKRMCRCTCRSLTAPAAQEHDRQATGLGLSPVTVLRCQGHPGNAAGPAHPPSGVLRPGTRGISVRLHRIGAGHRPQKARAITMPGIAAGATSAAASPLARAVPIPTQPAGPRTHAAPRPARTYRTQPRRSLDQRSPRGRVRPVLARRYGSPAAPTPRLLLKASSCACLWRGRRPCLRGCASAAGRPRIRRRWPGC